MLSLEILGMHACIAQLSHHPTGKSIQDILDQYFDGWVN